MVLMINHRMLGQAPSSLTELYSQHPFLLRDAEALAKKKPKRVEPKGVLYVRQKQWGVTHRGDTLEDNCEVLGCGTEDILTCHVIVLREPQTGVAAIGHFDNFCRMKDFVSLMNCFLERVRQRKRADDWSYWEEGEDDWEWEEESDTEDAENDVELDPAHVYDLHIVGGYADDSGMGAKISKRFFQHLNKLPIRLELQSCCLGQPNTK